MGNVNGYRKVSVNNNLLWDLPNKKLIYIDKMIENCTEITSKTQKVNFIGSIP